MQSQRSSVFAFAAFACLPLPLPPMIVRLSTASARGMQVSVRSAHASQIAQTCDIMGFSRDLGVMCDVTLRGVILTGCEIMGTQREIIFTPVA